MVKIKENKYVYLFKNMGILTISNFSSKILVFLLVPLYTSVLSTSEYGTYDIVASSIQLLFPILTLNISDAVMRFLMDDRDKKGILTIGAKLLVFCVCCSGILVFVLEYFNFYPPINNYGLLIFLLLVFNTTYQFFMQMAKGLEKVKLIGVNSIVSTSILLGLNLLFLLVFKWELTGFFWANIFSQAIPSLIYFFKLDVIHILSMDNAADSTLRNEMIAYSVPLLFTTIGWLVNSAADRYTVAALISASANGLLSVAYKIPGILNTVQSIFTQAWQISAIKEYDDEKSKEFYTRVFEYLNLIMCFTCFILIIFDKVLAKVLFVNDFYEAWKYVPFLLISCLINSASGFMGPILSAKKDSKNMARSAIYGSVVNVVLNVIFVKYFGIQGATIATVISSFIIFIVRRLAVGNGIDNRNIWKVYFSWLLLCIQATIKIMDLNFYFEIIIILMIIAIYFSEIKKIVINKGVHFNVV